eukprot:COSAG01_NODE_17701_length_1130_cov_1.837051_1_plen_114_part_00
MLASTEAMLASEPTVAAAPKTGEGTTAATVPGSSIVAAHDADASEMDEESPLLQLGAPPASQQKATIKCVSPAGLAWACSNRTSKQGKYPIEGPKVEAQDREVTCAADDTLGA